MNNASRDQIKTRVHAGFFLCNDFIDLNLLSEVTYFFAQSSIFQIWVIFFIYLISIKKVTFLVS